MKTRFFMAALAGALLLPSLGAQAQTAAESDNWKFSVMPYLWLPTVKATLNFDAKSVETKPDSYLDNLDFAGMLSGTARKGRWVIGSDLMYLHVSDSQSKVRAGGLLDTGGSIDLKGFVWTAAGGYSLILEPKANLDVIAGFRDFGLDTKVDTNIVFGRSVEKDANIWAGIIGPAGVSISAKATGSPTVTLTSAAVCSPSPGRVRPASAMPSSGATSFSTTAICITVRTTAS